MAKKEMTDEGLEEMQRLMDKLIRPGAGRPLREQPVEALEFLSTGSIGADWVCGGGIPRGRITEVFGPQQSGKSTLAFSTAAGVQRAGGRVAWVDAEFSYNGDWANVLGVDTDGLYFEQPDTIPKGEKDLIGAEQTLTFVELITKSDAFDLCVIDSVAALVPAAQLRGNIGDATMGVKAKLLSETLPRLAAIAAKSKTAIFFINQLRQKLGVQWGSPETTPGGEALPFYSSLRLDCRRKEWVKDGEDTIGIGIKLTNKKSRHGGLNRSRIVPLMFDIGLDSVSEILDIGTEHGLFTKSGSWYGYGGERMAQGRAASIEWLRARPELVEQLTPQVLAALEVK